MIQSILLASALAGLFVACDQELGAGIGVENRTSHELHFAVQLEPNRGWYTPPAKTAPHESTVVIPLAILPAGRCTSGGMIAFAEDGREIARHDAPLCVDDRWVIEPAGPGSTPIPTGTR
jgi:hypothetical protein